MAAWTNWFLVVGGVICVIVELALGAVTGFDLALVGASLTAGGAVGLLFGSTTVGLLAAAGLALLYLVLFRRWLKARLTVKDHVSNADAVIGKTGVVAKRIACRVAGMVKLGDETWRAELASVDDSAREVGSVVTVQSVEGVTLKVR
jgi:membrane protein implicated in regulation of membrane protease activity